MHTKELAEQRLVTGDGVTAGREVEENALGESPADGSSASQRRRRRWPPNTSTIGSDGTRP